jgi:hypothetical protein
MSSDRSLVGRWSGGADVIVAWSTQPRLEVALEIRRDGSVSGRVGDAVLVRGTVQRNRGAFARLFGAGTDFVIRAELLGEVLRAPHSTRARVSIPFNVVNGELRGSVFTEGAKVGPPERQQVVAANMVLRHD